MYKPVYHPRNPMVGQDIGWLVRVLWGLPEYFMVCWIFRGLVRILFCLSRILDGWLGYVVYVGDHNVGCWVFIV